MPIDAPILEAEAVLTTAIRDALAPFVGTFNARPMAYYQLAEQNCPFPYTVFQFQTDISRLDWIGLTGATVQMTLKALATSPKAARDLLAVVAMGMQAITITGYTITARYLRTPTIAPVDGVSQAMHVYRIRMERT